MNHADDSAPVLTVERVQALEDRVVELETEMKGLLDQIAELADMVTS